MGRGNRNIKRLYREIEMGYEFDVYEASDLAKNEGKISGFGNKISSYPGFIRIGADKRPHPGGAFMGERDVAIYKKIPIPVKGKFLRKYAVDEEGLIYFMDLEKDEFVHFTKKERVKGILKREKLLFNGPYSGAAPDVSGISSIFGIYDDMQIASLKNKGCEDEDIRAVIFKTETVPEKAYDTEVVWKEDVMFKEVRVVDFSEGKEILGKSTERIVDETEERDNYMQWDLVIYKKLDEIEIEKLKEGGKVYLFGKKYG